MQQNLQEDTRTAATLEVIQRFNDAFNRHDVGAVMAAMTDDCVFENTYPPPDGERYVGQAAVRRFWEQFPSKCREVPRGSTRRSIFIQQGAPQARGPFFSSSPQAVIEPEELFAAGDRCVMRWRYRWAGDEAGKPGYVRGVDIFRVRDGKVAEKFSYVKG